MSPTIFKTEALPSLLAGVARQPLPPQLGTNPKAALHALSLTGQALRFERPGVPAQFALEPVVEDDRSLLSDSLRRPFLRLLAGKNVTEHPTLAIARVMDELRLRPHPFDLPRIDTFVRRHAEQLGATAQHWARSKDDTAETAGYYDRDLLDETNWTQTTLGRRAGFLEALRRTDANHARTLLEAVWQQDKADARARLLQAMQIGLSSSDQPFLEGLQKDRSPRVRQTAKRLLAKLGVTSTENLAVNAALERITRKETGLLRKRHVLKLELPTTAKEQVAPIWIREAFAEVTLEELTQALSLNEAELVEASAKDTNLLVALALIATVDNRLDLFASIIDHLPNAWELISFSGLQDFGAMTRAERLRWAEILIRPYGRKLPWGYTEWSWLHKMLEGPAPELLIQNALGSDWADHPKGTGAHTQFWMEVVASLCPASQRQALRARLEAFDTVHTSTALPLLHLLDALENSKPHA